MKMIKFFVGVMLLAMAPSLLATVDLPTFYRTPFFQGEVRNNPGNWTTKIMARYGQGHAWDSLNEQSKKQLLLSVAGPIDIARLGFGATAATQPTSATYWTTDLAKKPQEFKFNGKDLPTGDNGKIDLGGRFETHDLGLELTQFIKYGFFAHVYVPFRQVKIDHISYKNKSSATVTSGADADFFGEKGAFNKILAEHNMQPLTTPFKKSGVSDVTASLGWHGYGKVGSEWIMDIAGNLQAGVIVPVAGKLDDKYVAAIPLGYNNSYGFLARGSGEIGVFDWVAVGAYVDSVMFLEQKQNLRMRTHEDQSGWLRLGKGVAKVETGTVWDCGGYVRLNALVPWLSLFGGYSFTRQEATQLTVKDSSFSVMLKKNIPTGIAVDNKLVVSNDQGDVDTVVNADPRLFAWEVHALHVGATMAIGAKDAKVIPRLQVEYTYPFDGKNIFKTPMLGGTAGLQFSLGF